MAEGSSEPASRILIVDDHLPNLLALEAILEPLGHPLVRAHSGEEALKHLLEQDFAVVLLDVQMPGMDGFETARLIRSRERNRTLPILFLTALHAEQARVMRAYATGAVDFLTKPLEPEVLRSKVSFFVDLHRKMEELKRPEASHPRSRLESAVPMAIWTTDAEGRVSMDSPGWRAFTGQSREGLLGTRAYLESIHPEDRSGASEAFQQARICKAPYEHEHRVRRHDGVYRWILTRALPVLGEDGKVREYVGTAVDVTDRRRGEQATAFLAEASEVLAASLHEETTLRRVAALIVPTLADFCAVDVVEPDGHLRRLATSHRGPALDGRMLKLVELYGLDPQMPFGPHPVIRTGETMLQELIDERFLSTLARTPEHAAALRTLHWCSGMIVPLKTRGRTVGAISLYFAESGRRYTVGDVHLAEDLARRCALCVDNARLYAEAQAAVRLRDDFLSVASHELKTPLTPLTLRLQTLGREAEMQPSSSLSVAVRNHLDSALTQVRRLSDLVNNLVDVSRLEGGRLLLSFEEVDAEAIVRGVVNHFSAQATQLGSELVVQAGEGVFHGIWDRHRVEQIVGNLVSNALKYGAGKPVEIRLHDTGDRLLLAVRDHGIGIAPENLERIFGRFERAVSERHYGGLGLGLFITHQLVQALGGLVHVDSAEGQGATFTVTLPKRPPPLVHAVREPAQAPAPF